MKKIHWKKIHLKKPDIKGGIHKLKNLKKEDVKAYWKARRERSYRFSDNLETMRHKEYPTVPTCPIIFYDNSGRRLKNE